MRTRIALGAINATALIVSITICVTGKSAGATSRAGVKEPPRGHQAFVYHRTNEFERHDVRTVKSRHDPARPTAGRARALVVVDTIAALRAEQPKVAPAKAVAQPTAPAGTDSTTTDTADWACIRVHESGDRYNTPGAPSGAYGFLFITWWSLGYSGLPYQASPAVQNAAALRLYHMYGWQPWSTRFVCGL